jgi:cytochrome c oxidase subunit 3
MSSDAHGATVGPEFVDSGLKQPYHLPDPSPWPIIAAFGGFLTLFGIILAAHFGTYVVLVLGVIIVLSMMFFWWRDVIREARTPGMHSPIVRIGLRYGMTLFITSEVMFFVGFFWAYFNFLIFPETQGNGMTVWPPSTIHTFDPFHLPFLNTMILLLSGCTVTWAHHSLIEGDRKGMLTGLGLTILLGLSFTMCQAIEYSHAPFAFVGGGVYPSTFFLATGFHGFHVIVGTFLLIVCWFRA